MSSFNKVILMGNMVRDPKLSYLPSQTAVCEFTIATSRKWRAADGSSGEETCFTDCQIYGKRAEVISKYFKKGQPIFVEGRLKLDQWTAQEGSKKSRLRVFVENFEFVGGNQQSTSNNNPNQQPARNAESQASQTQMFPTGGGCGMPDDDIPFQTM